ncbi:MAG: prephenate dehydrogenase/arogenate dehydrogenase family protein [Ilumatobacteraceae bacterium]
MSDRGHEQSAPGPSGADASRADAPRANIVGLGLIGGSLCAALKQRGWMVSGNDQNPERVAEALKRGLIDDGGLDREAAITFVAVPVQAVRGQVEHALAATNGLVTDVASVKSTVTREIHDPRFVGGHPMAGSELEGLDGADPNLFEGAVWVLTPTPTTADGTFAGVAEVVNSLGAEIVALEPGRHDDLVAIVSHVPHLAAATLMNVAGSRATEHVALLRLAAGGFRDMTRIASGHPAIWLDICDENRAAILGGLDALIEGLEDMRAAVGSGNRSDLHSRLNAAREARSHLPNRVRSLAELAEVRIPILDRPGSAAEVFTLAAELGVNISNFEVVHSAEGDRGIAVVLVDAVSAELFRGGLLARGYRPSVQRLG